MTKNLKALGLVLVAALALGAMVAPAASAQLKEGKLTSDGDFTLIGTKLAGPNYFKAFNSTVECGKTTYTGHKFNSTTTPKEFIPSGATAVTITPHWSECKDQNGVAATINMTGCDLELYDATTTGGVAGTYGVTAAVECKDNTKEYIHVDKPEPSCDVRVLPKTGITGAHLTDEGSGHLRLHGIFHNVTATTPCFDLETSTAEFAVDSTITGFSTLGTSTSVSLSD